MKKRVIAFIILVLVAIIGYYMIWTGYNRADSIYIMDYAVNDDNSIITIKIGNASSMGYIREAKQIRYTKNEICIDFYNCFGGLNSSIGSKSQFNIPIDKDVETISVYSGHGEYMDILIKDKDGNWDIVK